MTDPDFRTLYRRYYRLVWWVVRGAGVPETWAEDVVHDAFMAMHRRLPELDDPERLRTWVIGIARNAAFSHRRGAARRLARQRVVPEPEAPTAVDSAVAYRQAWDQLRRFLDELDDEQREAFVLCELQGVAPAEVAHALQISRNTVYSRLRLARSKLVECFSERSPAQLPTLLHAARQQGQPTREHQQRTWAALAASLPSLEPLAAAPAPAAATGWIATGKAALVSVSLAAATLGVIGAVGRAAAPAPAERPVSAASERRAPASSSGSAQASSPAPASAPAATPATTSTSAPAPARAAAPPAPASRGAGETAAEPEQRSPSQGSSPSSAPDLVDEVALLKQAALQLERGEPGEALASLDRHALAHPDSTLAPERLGLRVRALCATGQVTQAEALAARHVAEHPGSPLALKLASPCAQAGG